MANSHNRVTDGWRPQNFYIHLTDSQGPNPWDRVPQFFGDLLAALE